MRSRGGRSLKDRNNCEATIRSRVAAQDDSLSDVTIRKGTERSILKGGGGYGVLEGLQITDTAIAIPDNS